ncbi:MAG: hypothetical protein IKI61_05690 [Erysipelotrichaceae bacterium]|nr:hypothetical protein [Erysipelotrichaceae bacterium]
MKKIIVLFFVLLLMAGCSADSHLSKVSEGETVLFKGPNKTFTKQDLYKQLKVTDSGAITTDIMNKIALASADIDMDKINADADELINTYKEMGYEDYIIASYGSMEAYKDSYISTLLFSELSKLYVKDNYDTIIGDDKPVKMAIASFDSEEEALKCIEDVNNGSTFDMAAANNNSINTPSTSVYSDSDQSLVYEVKEYLNSTDKTGLSTVIVNIATSTDADGNQTEKKTYYVLNIESRNADEFKDEYIELKAAETEAETVRNHFMSSHEIKFYDQDLYELMSSTYEVLK